MDLELRLAPDDAARVPRHPMLAGAPRARGRKLRLVWHDSPDAALAAQGLALVEEQGAWRVERLIPGTAAWFPGAPVPVLEQAAELAALTTTLPPLLAPAAAFEGRRITYAAPTDLGPVDLVLWRGILRTVTTELPACRLHLSGEDEAVRAVALALTASLHAEIPRAALAAEALAAARGAAIPPRRLGAPNLPDDLGIADALAFVIGHLTDVILYFAPSAADDTEGPEPVHQMRVAVRRLRSTITVFQHVQDCAALAAANTDLKALAARLGATRDWDVFLGETAPAVTAAFSADRKLAQLLSAAAKLRREKHTALREFLHSSAFRRLGIELAWLASARSWQVQRDTDTPAEPWPALRDFAASVLQRRQRKLLTAGEALEDLDLPGLHGLRLRAKRLRYAAEIFAPLFAAKSARKFITRLAGLQDRLGVMNDGATAADLLTELGAPNGRHGYAAGLVQGFVTAGAVKLRPRVERSWDRFRRMPDFWG